MPGDYDAQVSIHGGLASHGLEHLAATDRGIIMMRNMIRQAIRTTQAGVIQHLTAGHAKVVATFAHDRVVSGIPPAATPEADRQLLREVARNVVIDAVRNVGAPRGDAGRRQGHAD